MPLASAALEQSLHLPGCGRHAAKRPFLFPQQASILKPFFSYAEAQWR